MLFNSHIFIFIFLPIAIIGYFGFNKIQKYTLAKYFLAGMSLWFYAYFNTSYLWIILSSIAVNYICHRLILSEKIQGKNVKYANLILLAGLVFDIGLIFYYKYFNFFIDNINSIFKTSVFVETILLPLGISFFTFQQIAFLVDTKRGEVDKQPFHDYILFVTFFPQLIAGPIVSHEEMLPQFSDLKLKRINVENMYTGIRIFILGLSKKVLIADTFGQAVAWGYGHSDLVRGNGGILLMVFYVIQLYFDFSGYCDMARGIGYMFNIQIPVNFDSPYKARNIADFWNRWHITLTRFFMKYIYIPLGGSRKGNVRTYVNIMIVFIVSGIWHGAGYTYIVWGLLHGALNCATRCWLRHTKKLSEWLANHRFLQTLKNVSGILLTFIFFCVFEVVFRAETLSQAWQILMQSLDIGNSVGVAEMATMFIGSELSYAYEILNIAGVKLFIYLPMILYSLLALYIVWGCKNIAEQEKEFKPTVFSSVWLSALAICCIMSFAGVNIFLYFNF